MARFIDLTGQHFGALVVISRAPNSSDENSIWNGCDKMTKRLDISGKTFHNIKVLEFSGISERGASTWRCKCLRCGREFTEVGHKITNPNRPKKDCGCSFLDKRKDLSGSDFGGLHVIRRVGVGKSGDIAYLCKCRICGNEKVFPACTIRSNPKSCGCKRASNDDLRKASAIGVAKTVVDGIQIYTATKTDPNKNNSSGYRWVRITYKNGNRSINATFYIRGKRYYKGGFLSPESANAWAEREHARMLEEENIQNPRIGAQVVKGES